MLSYLTGLSHAAIVACLLFVLHPAMDQDRNLAQVPAPYQVVYTPDCYIEAPDGREVQALPVRLQDLIEYESPAP